MNKQEQRRGLWRERIGRQEKSGQPVSVFCREQGLSEATFYAWRQRLREPNPPVAFALVETKPAAAEAVLPIEVMLASGARLRIPGDVGTLRVVLAVLQEQA